MKICCCVIASLLLAGCATGLKREGQCLASLTPDYLNAREELDKLEGSWRALLRRHDAELNGPAGPAPRLANFPEGRADEAGEAYRRLVEAKRQLRPTLVWYERVYERWRTRLDEEQILSDVRMTLLPSGSGMIFYPLISWNIHSVFWDDADPDAESDPITRYCTDRLAQMVVSTQSAPNGVE
ncbi:MAG TPA: hypothetical protein VGQ60_00130 [Nitrospiraceae bacterium]|jgi:hypothetical protein|nr:hypothetical protein [Nitrospiraceae bacterium]